MNTHSLLSGLLGLPLQVNLSAILLDLLAALALLGFLLVIAFYTLAALSGAGETNDGENAQPDAQPDLQPDAHPAPAPRQEGRL